MPSRVNRLYQYGPFWHCHPPDVPPSRPAGPSVLTPVFIYGVYIFSGEMIVPNEKYHMTDINNSYYSVQMKLVIKNFHKSDLGGYKCISKNSIGDAEGNIRLYGKLNQPLTSLIYSFQTMKCWWESNRIDGDDKTELDFLEKSLKFLLQLFLYWIHPLPTAYIC